jgi:hypothetical protein
LKEVGGSLIMYLFYQKIVLFVIIILWKIFFKLREERKYQILPSSYKRLENLEGNKRHHLSFIVFLGNNYLDLKVTVHYLTKHEPKIRKLHFV